jgi:hypothetical protein
VILLCYAGAVSTFVSESWTRGGCVETPVAVTVAVAV